MRWMVAMRYFMSHKRQSLVCIAGVTISVMMFIAMDAMMNGFKDKFIIETVESSGHVQVNDEPRETQTPILESVYTNKNALLKLERPKPRDVVKKIKNPEGLMRKIRALPGVLGVAPEVTGEAIMTYGTKHMNVAILGVEPEQQVRVTTIGKDLVQGDFNKLRSTADGIIIGRGVALVTGAKMGDIVILASSTGGKSTARVVGIFNTGVTPVDYSRVYMLLNNAQTLLDKKNLINRLTIRLDDYEQAQAYAQQIESIAGYKTESWQETNENFLKIFKIQDMITYPGHDHVHHHRRAAGGGRLWGAEHPGDGRAGARERHRHSQELWLLARRYHDHIPYPGRRDRIDRRGGRVDWREAGH